MKRIYLAQPPDLGTVDEEDLAIFDFRRIAEATHREWMAVDLLIAHRLVETGAEGVAAQDTDDKGIGGRGKGLRGPFYEARKIEQKNGLHLIFGGRIGGTQSVHAHDKTQADCREQPQHPL
jgi:hypothetical protein